MLIHMSFLIVDGTGSEVLPAVSVNPDPDIPSAETYSVVTVSEILSDIVHAKPSSLFVVQTGGSGGKWQVDTPQTPLLKKGERYLLFLYPDKREPAFDTHGTPRYNALGVWSGCVKIEDCKTFFLPSAVLELHKYDNTTREAFVNLVRARVDAVAPKNQIIMKKWCGPGDCPAQR